MNLALPLAVEKIACPLHRTGVFASEPHMIQTEQPILSYCVPSREHQEEVERQKALKEAKANAEKNGAQDKARMKSVSELLKEEGKR